MRTNKDIVRLTYTRLGLQLPNLCSMEINEIRPFFIRAMGVLTQLVREPEARQLDPVA